MGLSNEPQVTQVDPTNPQLKPLQGNISDFLGGLFQNPGQNPFGALTSPLQGLSTGGIQQFLSQPSPEQQTLQQVQPALQAMLNGQPMQNPFGDLGAVNQAQNIISAMQPQFEQNLETSLGMAANRAPSVQNSAFGRDVGNITNRALQDFNLMSQQALMQGLGLQQQGQQSALNFMLGANQQAQQGALGAGGLLGQLAGQAGQNPFQRLLGAGQLGNTFTQGAVNPTLQMLLGGMGFAQPQPLDTVVQEGGGGLGGFLGGLAGMGLGSFLGPIGSGLGRTVGEKLGGTFG